MTQHDFLVLILTAITVGLSIGGVLVTGGRWVLRQIIREDIQPLRDVLRDLTVTSQQLAREMQQAKADQREGRDELHDAVEAIREILNNHDRRIERLEDTPPTKAAIRTTRTRSAP